MLHCGMSPVEAFLTDSPFAYSLAHAESGWAWRIFDEDGETIAQGVDLIFLAPRGRRKKPRGRSIDRGIPLSGRPSARQKGRTTTMTTMTTRSSVGSSFIIR